MIRKLENIREFVGTRTKERNVSNIRQRNFSQRFVFISVFSLKQEKKNILKDSRRKIN